MPADQFYRVMMAARPKKSAIRNLLLYPLSYGSKVKITE